MESTGTVVEPGGRVALHTDGQRAPVHMNRPRAVKATYQSVGRYLPYLPTKSRRRSISWSRMHSILVLSSSTFWEWIKQDRPGKDAAVAARFARR